jgi:pimeloyl-ACP methyl ester carboxylesterase
LTVPVDPAEAAGGETLSLFVARIGAQTATPRPDPLLIITGGPGQSAVDFYLQQRNAFEQVRRDRELILMDQRGTGRSAEGFTCTVPEDLALETTAAESLRRYVESCLASLEHDPRFYTTSVAVQDLDRLRAAIGVEQWNVYGVSYGTRVAQHYLRRFPDRVRTLVIDGVLPPDLALGPDVARKAQSALDRIFERCAADTRCAERFAELPAEFAALLARLETQPVPLPAAAGGPPAEQQFGADHLRALVRFLSYNGLTVALLPVLLHEAHGGNYAPLVSQARITLRGLPESMSFPMSNSVLCTEDVPFIAAGDTDGLGELYLGTQVVDALRGICALWPAGKIDADFKALVVSAKPALVLSGSNDPITPPDYAQRVVDGGLARAVQLVGRDQGHGLAPVGCVPRLLRTFLETPDAELDTACLAAEAPMPFFLTLLGPAP